MCRMYPANNLRTGTQKRRQKLRINLNYLKVCKSLSDLLENLCFKDSFPIESSITLIKFLLYMIHFSYKSIRNGLENVFTGLVCNCLKQLNAQMNF